MTSHLHFDFIVNKEKKTVQVEREFAADLETVWDAWTEPQLLDQWWAPKPYQTRTKSMDFREGGRWLYAMLSPENVAHWCRADYQKIEDKKSFSGLDAFCDENGTINEEFPRSLWNNQFSAGVGVTTVNVTIQHKTLADLEMILSMGFK
ncbi:MAG TPA: SRPBCC domain-containing protein, partial [Puia sp.]